MRPCAEPLRKAQHFRAREIDLPIQPDQQFDSLHPRIMCGERPSRMDELVGQVLDGMAQDFERPSGFRRNSTASRCASAPRRGWRCSSEGEGSHRRKCGHASILIPNHRRCAFQSSDDEGTVSERDPPPNALPTAGNHIVPLSNAKSCAPRHRSSTHPNPKSRRKRHPPGALTGWV